MFRCLVVKGLKEGVFSVFECYQSTCKCIFTSIHQLLYKANIKSDNFFRHILIFFITGVREKGKYGILTINLQVHVGIEIFFRFCLLDNGPHYHNTGLLLYLAEVNQSFNLTLIEYNNFEAGEGKTVLDTHFAHISHKIVRWVRVGNNLQSGEQLGELIGVRASMIG